MLTSQRNIETVILKSAFYIIIALFNDILMFNNNKSEIHTVKPVLNGHSKYTAQRS